MARFVYFFVVSAALHAAALAYSVPSRGKTYRSVIPVTVLLVEGQPFADSRLKVNGTPTTGNAPKPRSRVRFTPAPKAAPKPSPAPSLRIVPEAEPGTFRETEPDLSPAGVMSPDDDIDTTAEFAWDVEHGPRMSGTAAAVADEPSGAPSGGDGASSQGKGSGPGGRGRAAILARYLETPRPNYPESARRQGREGRVLLRVLVDEQGRSKQVEINSSSGSEALDRAAAEAILRWRFHPARYGDKPVESWIRVPIEFRLAEANR